MSAPHCPFCLGNNLLKVAIVAQTDSAFLIPALGSERNYLIVPKQHVEKPVALPLGWWGELATLLAQVPGLANHYNISLNVGEHAGQTVKHLHFWVIPRGAGHATSGKGLATFIDTASRE